MLLKRHKKKTALKCHHSWIAKTLRGQQERVVLSSFLGSLQKETLTPWQECREALLNRERSFTKHLTLLFFRLTLLGAQSVALWLADNMEAFGED